MGEPLSAGGLPAVNDERRLDLGNRTFETDRCSDWAAVPVAVETYGRLGNAALAYLRELARAETAKVGGGEVWTTHAFLQSWCARLSVALHRANARAVLRAAGTRGCGLAWAEE